MERSQNSNSMSSGLQTGSTSMTQQTELTAKRKPKEIIINGKKHGHLKDQVGLLKRLELLDANEYLSLPSEAREKLIIKTIASGVIPAQVALYIEKSNKISQQIANIQNDSDYLGLQDYGGGFYSTDPD